MKRMATIALAVVSAACAPRVPLEVSCVAAALQQAACTVKTSPDARLSARTEAGALEMAGNDLVAEVADRAGTDLGDRGRHHRGYCREYRCCHDQVPTQGVGAQQLANLRVRAGHGHGDRGPVANVPSCRGEHRDRTRLGAGQYG